MVKKPQMRMATRKTAKKQKKKKPDPSLKFHLYEPPACISRGFFNFVPGSSPGRRTMNSLVDIGYIVKSHGVRGDLKFRLHEGVKLRHEVPRVFFVRFRDETLPYFTESFRYTGNREGFVHFEGLNNKEDAARLKSCTLLLEAADVEIHTGTENAADEWAGYTVEDITAGVIGTVEQVLAYPQQELLSVDYNGHKVLIPLSPELIIETDHEHRRLLFDLPEGLLEL
jgi:16S rRNA processing protein RimM